MYNAYLHEARDESSLMFKFRSGTHRLNEELGRHRGRERRKECLLCDDECESISHVLWDCSVYSTLRNNFTCKLQELLGDIFEFLRAWIALKKHLLFWIVRCGRMTLALCLLITLSMFGCKGRLGSMIKILVLRIPGFRLPLGNWVTLYIVGVHYLRRIV